MSNLTTTEIPRKFQFKVNDETVQLIDPNPQLTADEVCQFFATQYPELTNANVTNKGFVDDVLLWEFNTVMGTKG